MQPAGSTSALASDGATPPASDASGDCQGDATEGHHENLRLVPVVFSTVLPLNVTLAEND